MATPTAVNDQITDSVSQSNVSVVASSPSMAMGTIYQTTAHAVSMASQNATLQQQQNNTAASAVTSSNISHLLRK